MAEFHQIVLPEQIEGKRVGLEFAAVSGLS